MAKTGYNRASRVADQIRMEVADIIMRKTKDPRVTSVTVTDVDLTSDLRQAHVYFTTLTSDADLTQVQLGLTRAAGFIRSELGRRVQLRYTPELVFHPDLSGPKGDRVLSILEGLHDPRTAGSDEAHSESEDRGVGAPLDAQKKP